MQEELHARGIAVLSLDDGEEEERRAFADIAARARALLEDGRGVPMQPEEDWGLVHMEGVKRFLQFRVGAPHDQIGAVADEFHRLCDSICRRLMTILGEPLGRQWDLMDAPDASGLGSSIYRFFHYFSDSSQFGCQVHTDIGLLTLIPASNCPSLEVMDLNEFLFYNYERQLKPTDLMVLAGETLDRASGGYYPAVIHRVLPPAIDRFSLVYLMRARPDAILSTKGIADCPPTEDVTVAHFMRQKYLNKNSANFAAPGQGLPKANLKGETIDQTEIDNWAQDKFHHSDED